MGAEAQPQGSELPVTKGKAVLFETSNSAFGFLQDINEAS